MSRYNSHNGLFVDRFGRVIQANDEVEIFSEEYGHATGFTFLYDDGTLGFCDNHEHAPLCIEVSELRPREIRIVRHDEFCDTYVYVFGGDGYPLLKIGITCRLSSRKNQLKHNSGIKNGDWLALYGPFPAWLAARYERHLHGHFREARTCGEWFRRDQVPLAEIDRFVNYLSTRRIDS